MAPELVLTARAPKRELWQDIQVQWIVQLRQSMNSNNIMVLFTRSTNSMSPYSDGEGQFSSVQDIWLNPELDLQFRFDSGLNLFEPLVPGKNISDLYFSLKV